MLSISFSISIIYSLLLFGCDIEIHGTLRIAHSWFHIFFALFYVLLLFPVLVCVAFNFLSVRSIFAQCFSLFSRTSLGFVTFMRLFFFDCFLFFQLCLFCIHSGSFDSYCCCCFHSTFLSHFSFLVCFFV